MPESEYAVGYLSKPHLGAPFAPMSREKALEALPPLRRKWPDATLVIRPGKKSEWRRATTGEGGV